MIQHKTEIWLLSSQFESSESCRWLLSVSFSSSPSSSGSWIYLYQRIMTIFEEPASHHTRQHHINRLIVSRLCHLGHIIQVTFCQFSSIMQLHGCPVSSCSTVSYGIIWCRTAGIGFLELSKWVINILWTNMMLGHLISDIIHIQYPWTTIQGTHKRFYGWHVLITNYVLLS